MNVAALLTQLEAVRAALIEKGFIQPGSTYLKAFDGMIMKLKKASLKGQQ